MEDRFRNAKMSAARGWRNSWTHAGDPGRSAWPKAQHPIDGVAVEPFGIEGPADPDEHIPLLHALLADVNIDPMLVQRIRHIDSGSP
ncbi:MAG: hypothetical protein HIU85_06660 [Proteobacteria bacterium]|nr:hypothetical protein [Pseudomonadota bacterium]